MTEHVEIQKGDSIANLVEELASSVKEDSLTLPADRAIAEGEWVRFTLKLADGTDVMEGVGQSRGSMPRGNPVDRHDLVLGELQFDERNEIMWERLLIAAEAAKKGDETGTIQLGDGSIEEMLPDDATTKKDVSVPRQSAPPPPVPAAKTGAKDPEPKTAAKPAPAAPRRSSPPAPASAAKKALASKTTPAKRGHQIEVPEPLVARARRVAAQLPREMLRAGPGQRPEDAVLAAALRMGLAAMEAQGSRE